MAELIIDTPDKHDEVVSLLQEAGVTLEAVVCSDDGALFDNVFQVLDADIAKVEEVLAMNSIEFQWSGEDLNGEDYVDDVDDYDEE